MKSFKALAICLLVHGSTATDPPAKDPRIPSMANLLHDPSRPYLKSNKVQPSTDATTRETTRRYAYYHNAIRVGKCDGKVPQCLTTVWDPEKLHPWGYSNFPVHEPCTIGTCSKQGGGCVVRTKETEENFNPLISWGQSPDVYCW